MKRTVFLIAGIAMTLSAGAMDSLGVARNALKTFLKHPTELSEQRAAKLMLSPGRVDSITTRNTYSLSGRPILPFMGTMDCTGTKTLVHFNGTEWVVQFNATSTTVETSKKHWLMSMLVVCSSVLLILMRLFYNLNLFNEAKQQPRARDSDVYKELLRLAHVLPYKTLEFAVGIVILIVPSAIMFNTSPVSILWYTLWIVLALLVPTDIFSRCYARWLIRKLSRRKKRIDYIRSVNGQKA